jgi:transposase
MVTYVCLAFTLTVQEIGKLCEDKELKLEYLPPYSPDLNPIEYSFSVIKKAI